MEILYVCLVVLVLTRVFGEVAERIGLPALVGELISGVLLGLLIRYFASGTSLLGGLKDNVAFGALTHLGMFFLMLRAGIEMDPTEIAVSSRRSFAVATGGMIVPLGLGFLLGSMVLPESSRKFAQMMFLGTALSITALPVTVRALMDVGELKTAVGSTVVSAALWDDILSLVILAFLVGIIEEGQLPATSSLVLLVARILLFFAITIPIGWYVFPWIGRYFKRFKVSEVDFSGLVIAGLAYAVLAEYLDLHFIVGAFLAGVFFRRRQVGSAIYERVEKQLSGITSGFLAPLFFASIGLHLDPAAFTAVPAFLIMVIVIAFLGKIVGAGLPALWTGLSARQAWMVGIAMSARGAVELVVADVALEAGLFEEPTDSPIVRSLFSVIVIMTLVTTILMPILLRQSATRNRDRPELTKTSD